MADSASQDGYPYSQLGTKGQHDWPSFSRSGPGSGISDALSSAQPHQQQHQQDPTSTLKCTINFEECFGYASSHGGGTDSVSESLQHGAVPVTRRASQIFASVAFSKPTQCGDCSACNSIPIPEIIISLVPPAPVDLGYISLNRNEGTDALFVFPCILWDSYQGVGCVEWEIWVVRVSP